MKIKNKIKMEEKKNTHTHLYIQNVVHITTAFVI